MEAGMTGIGSASRKCGTVRDVAEFVQREFRRLADPVKAPQMQAYMKTETPFYGINKPERVRVSRRFKQEFLPANAAEWRASIQTLWDLPHREEKYAALDYAALFPEFLQPASMDFFGQLAREGAWWDLVDFVASRLVSPTLLEHRRAVRPVIDRWIGDRSLWVRRTALLSQLKHKERTDERQLFDHALLRCGETEFFIRKAIGWALRDYSWTAPQAVLGFLEKHGAELSRLSYREGGKRLAKLGLL